MDLDIARRQRHALQGPVRVVIVGTGPFAQRHAQAFAANPDCVVVGVASADADAASSLAAVVGAPHAATTLDELLARTDAHAVSVVNANALHLPTAMTALHAGASVLVEKPVVLTVAEGRQLEAAAAAAPGFVMPAHVLRFAAPYVELRHRLKSGAVGRPRAISFRRHRTADHDALFPITHPVLMTMIHDIDLALWLGSGPFRSVRARQIPLAGRAQPLAVRAEVETEGGVLISFDVSWSLKSGALPDALEIVGEEGLLALELAPRVQTLGDDDASVDDALTPDAAHGALAEEIRAFVDAVRFDRAPTEVTLSDALHGIDLAERIIEAATEVSDR
ncbi:MULTISPECIES: Gfo/Idh/MocA family protein [Microbacterium]|uniref:Gfo/Idh/MocA family protein n=1 Tax=Microbacterium TaxID=33882 RepID=UPI0014312142|nr:MULTISPECIES: Gfo/Idh/MocA family oxidoreductase [Microbacterium]MCK6065863.1 Gfo/Idh/MocA family oxidoreductase [Microbacterium sp. EYE_512]